MHIEWFHALLALVCAFAAMQSFEPIRRAGIAFAINALAVTVVKFTFGQELPFFNMLLDGVTAYWIMREPAGKVQGYLGYMFAAQIGSHLSFVISGHGELAYWQIINFIFLAQLVTLALWSEFHGGQLGGCFDRLYHRLFGRGKGNKVSGAR
jgi:hypothetical protein